MTFLKLGIITGEKSRRFYAVMMLAGYGIGLPVNALETWQIVNSNFDIVTMAKASLTYDLGRLPVTLGHVGSARGASPSPAVLRGRRGPHVPLRHGAGHRDR